MLDIIAPLGFAAFIRKVVSGAPLITQEALFVFVFVIYFRFLLFIIANIYCRTDYAVATAIRVSGRSPLALQYWMGDVISQLQRRAALLGWLLTFAALANTILIHGVGPSSGSALASVQNAWSSFVGFLWR